MLVAIVGSVALTRFDAVPAALSILALCGLVAGRWRLAGAILGLAIATKLYPAVLLPLAVVYAANRAGRRAAARVALLPVAIVALAYAPFIALSPGGVRTSLDAQFGRPLEIESVGGSLLAAAHLVFGVRFPQQQSYYEIPFHSAAVVAKISAAIGIVVLLVVWTQFARSDADDATLLTASAAALATVIAFGKVFSPQYLVWLIPLVPLAARGRRAAAALLLATACVLTALVFPRHWEALKYDLARKDVAAIVVRNALVVLFLATLLVKRAVNPKGARTPGAS